MQVRTAALCCALMSVQVHAASSIVFDSDPGDYIGGGQQQVFSPPAWSITSNGSTSHIAISIDGPTWWYLDFVAARGASFVQPGSHAGATRYPFNSPTTPGLSVGGDGRGCNTLTGWFEVLESLYDTNGALARLALDFKQNCEGGAAALYGAVRINSDVPVDLSVPHAIAGRPQDVFARDVVVLDGRQSFSRSGSAMTFVWEQLSGSPVDLRGSTTELADFVAPLVAPGGDDLVFRLTARTAEGLVDSDTVTVHVASKSDPQTFIEFHSEAGDYIGGGRQFRMAPTTGDISASQNYSGGVSVSYNGDTWYTLDFGPPQGVPFVKGSYEDAQRFAFADADHPGLDVSGDGRGCNTISGRFDVLDVLLTNDSVARFAVDFEQHCEGGPAALHGAVRYNYIPSGIPVARAGADQNAVSDTSVVLDGHNSSDDGGVLAFLWRQSAGPTVSLDGAEQSRASFVAPTVSSPQTLTFDLLVADEEDLTAVDTVNVVVAPTGGAGPAPTPTASPTPLPGASSGSSGGGALKLELLAVLLLAALVGRPMMFRYRLR